MHDIECRDPIGGRNEEVFIGSHPVGASEGAQERAAPAANELQASSVWQASGASSSHESRIDEEQG